MAYLMWHKSISTQDVRDAVSFYFGAADNVPIGRPASIDIYMLLECGRPVSYTVHIQ